MFADSLLEEIIAIVGKENVSSRKTDRITHSFDATQKQYLPDLVTHPETAEQVQGIVRLAAREKIPILARGAGSGFSGGSAPVHGGIVLALTRMNRIIEIDTENLIAVVEPGVVTADLQAEVEKLGLFYPPDPASKAFSTLGGNVAECAGGPRCLKYGVTRDYVLGLEVVCANGELMRTGGRTMKNVVGYDLTRLMVGSEGSLGIVTQIILRLLPKPAATETMLAAFADMEGAAQAVAAIIREKIIPATLEFMDKAAIDCVRDRAAMRLPPTCQAVLIIEADGEPALIGQQIARIMEIIRPFGLLQAEAAQTTAEAEAIWQLRRSISPSLRRLNPDKFNEDIVVPRSRLPEMIRFLQALAHKHQIPIVNFGHAGDGNIHVNVMADLRQAGMEQTVAQVLEAIFRHTVALGGSVSGEHGIGVAKAPYIGLEVDPVALAAMRSIKQALDPDNILNPGKIFPIDERKAQASAQ